MQYQTGSPKDRNCAICGEHIPEADYRTPIVCAGCGALMCGHHASQTMAYVTVPVGPIQGTVYLCPECQKRIPHRDITPNYLG